MGPTKAVDRLPHLWLYTYEVPMKLELAENDFLGLNESALQLQSTAPLSTYQERGLMSKEQAVRREIMDGLMRIKWAAAARHANNQRDVPFSMLARSIGKLACTDAGKTWVEDRSILSKVRSVHYLNEMLPLRPPPPFKVAMYVSAYAFDQYYMKEHCNGKDGEYRGRKSVSTTGFTHTWRKITNINTVEVRRAFEATRPRVRACTLRALTFPVLLCVQIVVPATAFTPTEAQLKEIITLGPYTEPMSDVYPRLQLPRVRTARPPAARRPPPTSSPQHLSPASLQVKQTLRRWMDFHFDRVFDTLRDDFGVQVVQEASLAQVARGLLKRPSSDPGSPLPSPPPPLVNVHSR